jgi:hypothetical protein
VVRTCSTGGGGGGSYAKSKEVIFSPYRKPHKEYGALNLRQDAIQRSDSHKHSGFILDTNLDFNEHLANVTVKYNNLLNLLRQQKRLVRSKQMYQSFYSTAPGIRFYHLCIGKSESGQLWYMVHQGISRRVLRGATYDPGH